MGMAQWLTLGLSQRSFTTRKRQQQDRSSGMWTRRWRCRALWRPKCLNAKICRGLAEPISPSIPGY